MREGPRASASACSQHIFLQNVRLAWGDIGKGGKVGIWESVLRVVNNVGVSKKNENKGYYDRVEYSREEGVPWIWESSVLRPALVVVVGVDVELLS